MDHPRTPVLDALSGFRDRGDVTYGPPGHRQGPGVDPRVLTILGEGVFASEVLGLNGVDDRPRPSASPARGLELETVVVPHDEFLIEAEQVPAGEATGRIAAGMLIPEVADPEVKTVRVVRST